jgi:hypothetical protein
MRRTLVLLSLLLSPALFAQRPSSMREVVYQLDRLEPIMRERAAGIRRDAFLVSQIVIAIGDLDDFQRNAAMQKARDRIDAAMRRARENPAAAAQTLTALSQTIDLIRHAQEQASTADIPALKRDMLRNTHVVQQVLFRELQESRADRQVMTELQARLSRMSNELDQALDEALGSTFDYFRAGGQ